MNNSSFENQIEHLSMFLGVPAIKYFRSDLRLKFDKLFHDDRILLYLYHCNTRKATGEQAFRTMSDCFAWAKGKTLTFDQNEKNIFHRRSNDRTYRSTRSKHSNLFSSW